MLKQVVDFGIPAGIFVLMLIAGTEMAVRDFAAGHRVAAGDLFSQS